MTGKPLLRDAGVVGLAILIGMVTALALGQFVLVRLLKERLNDYTAGLLQHAAEVASVSIATFAQAGASTTPLCSDADLNALRYLLFYREHLHDIGRVRDGQLLCTAGWGRLDPPVRLPPPQRRQANGDELWANVESPVDRRLTVDMAGHGSVVVFTAPTAFKTYERFDPAFSALVLTQDGRHIYRAYGDTGRLLERFLDGPPLYEAGPRVTAARCVTSIDVCVVAALSGASLLHQPPATWLAIAGSGGLLAGGLGVALILRRRQLLSLPHQIRRAIAENRLDVVYQPLVQLKDDRMVGVEALVRPTDQQGRAISPDIFIRIAEATGMIGTVTRFVIHKALGDMCARLTEEGDFHVSINVTAADVADLSLHAYLDAETGRLGIPRRRVILELTERSTTCEDGLASGVEAFRDNGYGFFIDDLGTGYSSLAYLANLRISGIKVDRMFTQAIGKKAVSSTIVEKICAIADSLGVTVVVEGVETPEQATYIRKLHPEAIAQGWLFGRPVSADRL